MTSTQAGSATTSQSAPKGAAASSDKSNAPSTASAKAKAKAKAEAPLDEFGGPIGQGQVRTIRAPWSPSTITRVRKAVVADLRARDLAEQTVDESEIVVSELVANAIVLLLAGHETTAHLIANSLVALLRNPAELQRLRDNPALPP